MVEWNNKIIKMKNLIYDKDYLLKVLFSVKENEYDKFYIRKLIDDYIFEEEDNVFSESFANEFGYIIEIFREVIEYLKPERFKYLVDTLIVSLDSNFNKEEILYLIYKDELNSLYQKLIEKKINQDTFKTEVNKCINTENYSLDNLVLIIVSK